MREAFVVLLFTVGLTGWAYQTRRLGCGWPDVGVVLVLCLAAALAMVKF